jgi:hypothetical protein
MPVTLTANYRQVFSEETLTLIDKLREDLYDLEAMITFIDENSEEDFQERYELYVELGEKHDYEAVDAFIKLNDAWDLPDFENAFLGCYLNPRDMAEEFFEGETDRLDYRIQIDWEETAQYLLGHEVDREGDYYFRHSW